MISFFLVHFVHFKKAKHKRDSQSQSTGNCSRLNVRAYMTLFQFFMFIFCYNLGERNTIHMLVKEMMLSKAKEGFLQ